MKPRGWFLGKVKTAGEFNQVVWGWLCPNLEVEVQNVNVLLRLRMNRQNLMAEPFELFLVTLLFAFEI